MLRCLSRQYCHGNSSLARQYCHGNSRLVRHSKRSCVLRTLSQASPAVSAQEAAKTKVEDIRNIGVSAHIDSGKTTVTERILYFSGKIDSIHDVKGKDGVGATMDSMEIERQRGITIKSAATSLSWKGKKINLIDTPGHIDFTVEVERALRVLDGAILVLCASRGVQTQTFTVYRQMQRYDVPFIGFINKCDRLFADPYKTLQEMRSKIGLNAALLYLPIGIEKTFEGIIDVMGARSVHFEGTNGDRVVYGDVPAAFEEELIARRLDILERLSNVDEEIGERYLMEEEISTKDLHAAIKRTVIARTFTPVIVGSALKNKGVQPLLDCVTSYLPNPTEVENYALSKVDNSKVLLNSARSTKTRPIALAFKLEQSNVAQLTYMRIYQGCFRRGNYMINTRTGDKYRVPRLVLMHSNQLQDVDEALAGDIIAMIGIDCASGDTFIDAKTPPADIVSLESMFVPDPVISMTIKNLAKKKGDDRSFSKALNRFQKEDPTFKSDFNPETKEMVVKGMGELQLEIYAERMRREYDCVVELGVPTVNYRECLSEALEFSVTYKRQSGGKGQYAHIVGKIEPLEDKGADLEWITKMTGGPGERVPPNFVKSTEKGVREAMNEGALSGHPIAGIRITLTGGKMHEVDSSDFSFSKAGYFAIKENFVEKAITMEPWMDLEITAPSEYSGTLLATITARDGVIKELDMNEDLCVIYARAPLKKMFGYTTELRSCTSGLGVFTMEFRDYMEVEEEEQERLIAAYRATNKYKNLQGSGFGT